MKTLYCKARNMIIFLFAVVIGKTKTVGKLIVLSIIHTRTFPRALGEFSEYLDGACKHLFDNCPRLISMDDRDALHVLFDDGTDDEEDWKMIRKKTTNLTTTGGYWTKKQGVRRHEIEQLLLKIYGDRK